MQSQIVYDKPKKDLDLKDMELNIGVITPLTSPYNLFLNVRQIVDPDSEAVYFFIYSFGKKKVVLWGVYLKNEEEFVIEGGCKYAVKNLNKYLKEWKSRDYSYIGNSVYDRITGTIARELGQRRWEYTDYLRYKFVLAYYQNLISEDELKEKYSEEPYIFLDEVYEKYKLDELIDSEDEINEVLNEELISLEKEIREYEANINRTDLNRQTMFSLPKSVRDEIKYITELFYRAIKLGYYTEGAYYTNLEKCPSVQECAENYNSLGCEVVYYGDNDLGMLSSKDLSELL